MNHKLFVLVSFVIALLLLFAVDVAPVSAQGYGGGCQQWHQVRYGETLSGIARYYGVSTQSLAQANGLYNPNYIRAGSTLCIPCGSTYSYGYTQPHYGYGYTQPYYGTSHTQPYYGSGYTQPYYGYGYTQPYYGYKQNHYGYTDPGYGYGQPHYGYHP